MAQVAMFTRRTRTAAMVLFGLLGISAAIGTSGRAAGAATKAKPQQNLPTQRFPKTWQASELRDHPLVGRIWSARKNGFIDAAALRSAIAKADYLLLGEVHDNPDAHRLQAWALTQFAVSHSSKRPVVVMEMLNEDQQAAVDEFYQKLDKGSDQAADVKTMARKFFEAVSWQSSGWPDGKLYQPIISAVLKQRAKLVPGSASRKAVRQIGKTGFANLTKTAREELQLTGKLSSALLAALTEELKEGHCNMLPERAIPAMLKVQRYRDAKMADAMISGAGGQGAVLIAGNGHVRKDRAVPWYLTRRARQKSVVVISHLEVSESELEAADYMPQDPSGKAASDYVIFTPRQAREDQCEALRKMFKKGKPKK